MIGWKVGKHINGIAINSLEWLLDMKGEVALFPTKQSAVDFLKENGATDDDIYYFKFYVETKCLNCGEDLELSEDELSKDGLGCCYYHEKCGSSFDVLASE